MIPTVRNYFQKFVKLFTDRRIWVRQISVTAIAAATAWQVGDLVINKGGLVAAIVCSLSIRVSLHKSVREGLGQIIGTAIGAVVALTTVYLFHFGFLVVGSTVIFCSVVARALHLGEVASVNVPVTALIVIGPGLSESTAWHRLLLTLIGAGIAMVFSFFSHPKSPAGRALDKITSVGFQASELLGKMAAGVAQGYSQDDAGSWLAKARLLMEEIPAIRSQALEAKGYARWFPTAEQDEAEELYMRGVAVEHTIVQVRTIARTLFDSAVEGVLPHQTAQQIAHALSAASFGIRSKIANMKVEDSNFDEDRVSDEVRQAGAELAETLIEAAESSNQDQLVRNISLVSNIDRIADSLDESSPALKDVVTPDEPAANKILQVSPLEQSRRFGSSITRRMPKGLRKYF